MELFGSKIKKILMFSQKEVSLYFRIFFFFIFQEMELLGSNIKKFQETETTKKIPYISGNRNPRKAFYILGNETLRSTHRKIFIL